MYGSKGLLSHVTTAGMGATAGISKIQAQWYATDVGVGNFVSICDGDVHHCDADIGVRPSQAI